MKDLLLLDSHRMQRALLHLRLGAVLVVICHTNISLLHILVGARKNPILGPCPVYLHTLVAKHAHGLAEDVLTHVTRLVMQVPAHHVQQWVQPKIVSVVVTHPRSAARIPIMKMDGAVEKSVVTFYHVESIHALYLVMKVFVVPVRSRLMHVAIVAKSIQTCCVAPGTKNSTVKRSRKMDQTKSGRAPLLVPMIATVPSTVECIFARRAVILKTQWPLIALVLPIQFPVALVAKHL